MLRGGFTHAFIVTRKSTGLEVVNRGKFKTYDPNNTSINTITIYFEGKVKNLDSSNIQQILKGKSSLNELGLTGDETLAVLLKINPPTTNCNLDEVRNKLSRADMREISDLPAFLLPPDGEEKQWEALLKAKE